MYIRFYLVGVIKGSSTHKTNLLFCQAIVTLDGSFTTGACTTSCPIALGGGTLMVSVLPCNNTTFVASAMAFIEKAEPDKR